jgi:hypothetical protein
MQTPNTDAAARNTYEIGGTTVLMTPAAAAAWNAGDLSEEALAGAEVLLLDGARVDLWEYIGREGDWRSEAANMAGCAANWIRGDAQVSDRTICTVVAFACRHDDWAERVDSDLRAIGVRTHDDQPDGSDPWEIVRLADGRMVRLVDESARGADRYSVGGGA